MKLENITIQDIENHKYLPIQQLKKDLQNLKNFDITENKNNFYGNKFLYHYQFKNLLKCRRENTKKTLYDIYNDPIEWNKLLLDTKTRNRNGKIPANNIFECFRINRGSVVMFKATTAKYLYQKYKATNVLDPTMGWGGRMLGAWALDIGYTGIDTNIEMKPAYDSMLELLNNYNGESNTFSELFTVEKPELKTIWDSCLNVDFSKIDYDFVLTSPPYVNLEIYEHMKLWDSDTLFYKEFFIPLWHKCIDNITIGGHVCFNISPKMYTDAIINGLPICDIEEDLLQQIGQKKKNQDKIYIWKR